MSVWRGIQLNVVGELWLRNVCAAFHCVLTGKFSVLQWRCSMGLIVQPVAIHRAVFCFAGLPMYDCLSVAVITPCTCCMAQKSYHLYRKCHQTKHYATHFTVLCSILSGLNFS